MTVVAKEDKIKNLYIVDSIIGVWIADTMEEDRLMARACFKEERRRRRPKVYDKS